MGINGITSSQNRFPSHDGFPIGKEKKIFSKSKFYDLKEVISENGNGMRLNFSEIHVVVART